MPRSPRESRPDSQPILRIPIHIGFVLPQTWSHMKTTICTLVPGLHFSSMLAAEMWFRVRMPAA